MELCLAICLSVCLSVSFLIIEKLPDRLAWKFTRTVLAHLVNK